MCPRYDFLNTTTNEIEEHSFSWKEYDQFLIDNPQLKRYHTVENLHVMSDAIRMSVPGTVKADAAFEHGVIDRIKATVPGNTLHKTHKTHGSKWE
jgi:hypothetical protein